MRTIVPLLAAVMGLGAVGNGIFMLIAPADWYLAVPGVAATGPYNQHFVRDIGMTYGFVGAALVAGAAAPVLRAVLWAIASAWLAAHAVFHFWEVAVGICGPSQLLTDLPAVTTPALLAIAMTAWAALGGRRASNATARVQPIG
jgi:hypothetical protein